MTCFYCEQPGEDRACGRVLCDDHYKEHLIDLPDEGIAGCSRCRAALYEFWAERAADLKADR